MRVFVTGLIYFNGCQEEVMRAFAPDGTEGEMIPHYASLWIAPDQIDDATTWWEDFRFMRNLDGVDVVEFRIPDAAEITFPDLDNDIACDDLERKLPKLKKKKKGKKGAVQNFIIDPAAAETIAEVTIRGGHIKPLRFGNAGLVQWTIPNPSAPSITVALKEDDGDSRTITLNSPAAAEVVFANSHDLFTLDEHGHDALAGNHIVVFRKLNPALPSGILVSQKPQGNVDVLQTENGLLNYMKNKFHICGETPPCCRN